LKGENQMSQNTTPEKIAAVDVGFDGTKGLFTGIPEPIRIPSAVAAPRPAEDFGTGGGQRVFVLDHGKYVFGQDALDPGSKQIQSLDTDWLLKYMVGFICASAAKAGADLLDYPTLSVGLPIKAWKLHANYVREKLRTFICNGITYAFDRIDVRPQGVGVLGHHGELGAPANECGMVLDIGGNTVLVVRYNNLRPVGTDSHQYDGAGVLEIAQSLMPLLEGMAGGHKVTMVKAMQAVIVGRFWQQDISTHVAEAKKAYSEKLLNNIRSDYGNIIPELDRLVVAGGGAYLIGEALKNEYPRTIVLAQPEFANVRGYAYLSSCNN
jgi:hypothetical protein